MTTSGGTIRGVLGLSETWWNCSGVVELTGVWWNCEGLGKTIK